MKDTKYGYTQVKYIMETLFESFDYTVIEKFLPCSWHMYKPELQYYILIAYNIIVRKTDSESVIRYIFGSYMPFHSQSLARIMTFSLIFMTSHISDWKHIIYKNVFSKHKILPEMVKCHTEYVTNKSNALQKENDNIKRTAEISGYVNPMQVLDIVRRIEEVDAESQDVSDALTLLHDDYTRLFFEWQCLHGLRFVSHFSYFNKSIANTFEEIQLQQKFIECIKQDFNIAKDIANSKHDEISFNMSSSYEEGQRMLVIKTEYPAGIDTVSNVFKFYDPIVINE